MSVAELFYEHFDGAKFDSIDEYKAEVHRFANETEEELGRVERYYAGNPSDVIEELDITIKEV